MDRSDEIEQLTTQLRNVSLRLAQLEAAANRENKNECSAATAAALNTAAPSSADAAAAPDSAKPTTTPIIQKGDRVRITNAVNKPKNWNREWEQNKAQEATVTHFYRGQVHFITDNGIRTWRAVNNLAKLR
jgi:alpha/beta superfamily hydrolase